MDKIREYLKEPKIVGITALIIGILLGWFVIGWGLWPVTYKDADLVNLRSDAQERAMKQVIEAYAMNGNANDAVSSWEGFGKNAVEVFSKVQNSGEIPADNLAYFEQLLTAQEIAFPEGLPIAGESITMPDATSEILENIDVTPTPDKTEKAKTTSTLGILLGAFFVLFLIGVGVLAYFFFFRKSSPSQTTGNRQRSASRTAAAPRQSTQPVGSEGFGSVEGDEDMGYEDEDRREGSSTSQYLRQFVTEYVYGNDLYDDTFSIDAATGEFLGECGLGISDTIGSTEPKNVTAFEVWLFDKNDVQTVTKVLMSDYAMNNPNILQRLEVKGEPIQIRPDTVIELETATLKLEAKILDVTYGRGGQAENSFVQQMQVELTVTSNEILG